jgi:uncharacterized repeat protein (TIGR03803 family)
LSNTDGYLSMATLFLDSAGNLYGTTLEGGDLNYCGGLGCGVVFRLSPSNRTWQFTVLHNFTNGADGGGPYSGVVVDAAGNVYGTTANGGSYFTCPQYNGCGVAFMLSPTASGTWKETVIHSFTGGWDGSNPISGLLLDTAGDLYGTAFEGGMVASDCEYGCGVVYRLSPTSSGNWMPTVLHTFTGKDDGSYPSAPLIWDAAGNLYGTTSRGGNTQCITFAPSGCGTVFELSPSSNGQWREEVLHKFAGGQGGAVPVAPVVFDSSGNLFGTTGWGGRGCFGEGCGTVFEMKPTATRWTGVTLITFLGGYDGLEPFAGVVPDSAGHLYGTAGLGITARGLVFEITPSGGT